MRCLLVPLLMLLLSPVSLGGQTQDPRVGTHIRQPIVSDFADYAKDAGVKWVRVTAYWASIESTNDGWDWNRSDGGYFDDTVNALDSVGFNILVVVVSPPNWLEGYPDSEPDYNEYKEFLDSIESRYGNKINHYEVWNEAYQEDGSAITDFWDGSMSDLVALVDSAQSAVGASNTVLCCGFQDNPTDNNFVADFADSVGVSLDIITLHSYADGHEGSNVKGWVQEVLSETSGYDVWMTEFGVSNPTSNPPSDDGQMIDYVLTEMDNVNGWDKSFHYAFDRDSTSNPLVIVSGSSYSGVYEESYCQMVKETGNLSYADDCVDDLSIDAMIASGVPPNTTCYVTTDGPTSASYVWKKNGNTISGADSYQEPVDTGSSDFTLTIIVDGYYTESFNIDVAVGEICAQR